MKRLRSGVMLSGDDVRIVQATLELAIENVNLAISSDHVPNPMLRTIEDVSLERERKQSRREYQQFQRRLELATSRRRKVMP